MDLREYFNKLFDEMFVQKEREMGVLAERNSRLRTILSELRITCNGLCLVLNNKVLFSIAISNFNGLIGFLLFQFVKSVYNRNLTVCVVAFRKVNATLSQYCYDLVFPDSKTF